MENAFCVEKLFVSMFVRSFAIRKENELNRMDWVRTYSFWVECWKTVWPDMGNDSSLSVAVDASNF